MARGIPAPELQYWVLEARCSPLPRLDLAWPQYKVAVEYQGDHHRIDKRQWARDNQRAAALAAAGWLVIPATWEDVYLHADRFAARVRQALATRGRR